MTLSQSTSPDVCDSESDVIMTGRRHVTVYLTWVHYSGCYLLGCNYQGDHLAGKPGNVRDFDSCQANVRDFTKSQGSVRQKSCRGKWPKLFTVGCIFAFVQVFCSIQFVPASYEYHLTCHESLEKCQGISQCLDSASPWTSHMYCCCVLGCNNDTCVWWHRCHYVAHKATVWESWTVLRGIMICLSSFPFLQDLLSDLFHLDCLVL